MALGAPLRDEDEKIYPVNSGSRGMARNPADLARLTSELYDELYKDWRRVDRFALADGARERIECLWLSPSCPVQELF